MFIIMCEKVIDSELEIFNRDLKDDLISLYTDRVANVRIMLSRTLRKQKV